MVSIIATLLSVIFIIYLFWKDGKEGHPSNALWVPFLWMFFGAGRYLGAWLQLERPTIESADSFTEGSPVNAACFFLLIAAGILILNGRKIDWRQILARNKLVFFYLLYCLASVLWSDYSVVSFKRWLKELGNLVMVLVILTDDHPLEALGTVLRRLGFLWLPLSVLFIKYYPDLGREYTEQGIQMFTGIGEQKNQLGQMCLISTIYYGWQYILLRKPGSRFWKGKNVPDLILIAMLLWLFHMSDSVSSMICAVVAIVLFLLVRITAGRNPGRVVTWVVLGSLFFFILGSSAGLKDSVFKMFGRDPTLTGRTEIWSIVKEMNVNPVVGAGYQGFWLGNRLKLLWEKIGADIIQAHNGYLEQYLNLGYIGVAFVIAIMLSGLVRARRKLYMDPPLAVLMLSFIITAAIIDYTEASFYAINNIWLLLILAVVEPPDPRYSQAGEPLAISPRNNRFSQRGRTSVSWNMRDRGGWAVGLHAET
jgi:hypothetical protein